MISCSEFTDRLHDQLDRRLPPESDCHLRAHAEHCRACRQQLHAWHQIAEVVPSRSRRLRPAVVCGLAAAVLLAVWLRPIPFITPGLPVAVVDHTGSSKPGKPSDLESILESERIVESERINDREPSVVSAQPSAWWHQVSEQDWFAQTIPTVRRVREGVAPLGRSLFQAVTILTVGGGGQTT